MILTAIAIVREKERGTMEQLIVTPIRRFELILGKAIPFIGLGYVNVAIVILVGTFWFEVAIAGSLLLLLALTGLFILTCLGMGLVVSAISNTQQQASMAGQFVMLPEHVLLGLHVPDREHAADRAEAHLPDPAALLHHDRRAASSSRAPAGRSCATRPRSCSSTAS